MAGTVGFIDFGLGMSITREAATSLSGEGTRKAAPFIKAAGTICFLIGIIGGLIIATLGLPLSRGLHLSAASRPIATTVFALAGASFLADRLLAFTMAVLRGLRRFDLINLLATLAAIIRAIGIIALIKTGSGVVAVMVWQVASTSVAAIAGQWLVRHLQAEFRFQFGSFNWNLVQSGLAFGLACQLTSIVEIMIWDIAPLVVVWFLAQSGLWFITSPNNFQLPLAPSSGRQPKRSFRP